MAHAFERVLCNEWLTNAWGTWVFAVHIEGNSGRMISAGLPNCRSIQLQLHSNCTVEDFRVHYGERRGPDKLRQLRPATEDVLTAERCKAWLADLANQGFLSRLQLKWKGFQWAAYDVWLATNPADKTPVEMLIESAAFWCKLKLNKWLHTLCHHLHVAHASCAAKASPNLMATARGRWKKYVSTKETDNNIWISKNGYECEIHSLEVMNFTSPLALVRFWNDGRQQNWIFHVANTQLASWELPLAQTECYRVFPDKTTNIIHFQSNTQSIRSTSYEAYLVVNTSDCELLSTARFVCRHKMTIRINFSCRGQAVEWDTFSRAQFSLTALMIPRQFVNRAINITQTSPQL